ncbi:transcriptional regulator, ArsR family [Hymenobacter roseosalivarius DSM 11622]|uniref:Transcriptional regulator, ArsR family n=1 Tax=Hymenobacter roseosalivarius DSM 11622 TaxID=645990 RepID=A0A1W1W2A5_9BACT|nr:metalloregulator ArsR/SmtB family transcription factor [Hymenobacter roseosalivarius]SMB99633.1 transcriptional regulator, ArsR family [Hymenobacter roseosalivarius DSM 11622]
MTDPTCIRVYADAAQLQRSQQHLATAQPKLDQMAAVLSLAGNEVRLRILLLLAQEQLCVCDLADVLGMNISAVSQHLRKLKDGGVVQARKVGQTVFYRLHADQMAVLQPLLSRLLPTLTTPIQ